MREFSVDWPLPSNFFRNESRRKLQLNEEWSIRCIISFDGPNRYIDSVQIHRENGTGEFLVSGKLEFRILNRRHGLPINFSKVIKTATSTTVTDNTFRLVFGSADKIRLLGLHYALTDRVGEYRLQGSVKISSTSEKLGTRSANIEFKERIQIKSIQQLSNDFNKLLDPKTSRFTDVTLICGGVSIPAHKLILSARSPVFEAMFANPMKESRNHEVDIDDIEVSTLRALLEYIYSGKTPAFTASLAENLLFAADKYQLQDLKAVCCHFLKDTASLQSVLRILVLGDLHDEDLKSFAMDYICNVCASFSGLEKTEEWNVLRKERPALAMDVLTALVKSKEKK